MVEGLAVGVEQVLELGQVLGRGATGQPLLHPLMGTFVFPACLGVSDTGGDGLDAQVGEPGFEVADPTASFPREGRRVVGEQLSWQAVAVPATQKLHHASAPFSLAAACRARSVREQSSLKCSTIALVRSASVYSNPSNCHNPLTSARSNRR